MAEILQTVSVSKYLASCALTALQYAGLLQKAPPVPSPIDNSTWATKSSVSAVIVHSHAQADLDKCLDSVLGQEYPALTQVTVIVTTPVALCDKEIRLVSCQDVSFPHTLVEQLAQVGGDAILLLDSQIDLAPGALAEMVRACELRDDVAAVAPRVMWRQWPGFVVQAGDWRSATEPQRNPYAGCLDVGQFERWQESPAMSVSAGLISRTALEQVGLPDAGHGLDWLGAAWCYQARLHGYHILTALQAVAVGPWPGAVDLMQETRDKLRFVARNFESSHAKKQIEIYRQQDQQCPPDERDARRRGWASFRSSRVKRRGVTHPARSDELLNALAPPEPALMLRQGQPLLTVDNIRAVYGQYPAIAPLPMRRRVVFVGLETDRRRAMAQQLAETCEVGCITPRDEDDASLRQLCATADLVVVSAEAFHHFDFLYHWHGPILVDSPPRTLSVFDEAARDKALRERDEADDRIARHWIQLVDGVVCASEAERAHWLEQFERVMHARSNSYPWQAALDRDSLLMIVPTPPDAQAIAPLLQFCQQPYTALDRQIDALLFREPKLPPLPTPLWALPGKVWQTLKQNGRRKVVYEMIQYIRWKIGL
ncbi:MAG: glycosyltransferase family 2 protein [Chloroflexi bacterium]|nr:glycosyltransferase family 2 protein [Chloroflexota bacterium]